MSIAQSGVIKIFWSVCGHSHLASREFFQDAIVDSTLQRDQKAQQECPFEVSPTEGMTARGDRRSPVGSATGQRAAESVWKRSNASRDARKSDRRPAIQELNERAKIGECVRIVVEMGPRPRLASRLMEAYICCGSYDNPSEALPTAPQRVDGDFQARSPSGGMEYKRVLSATPRELCTSEYKELMTFVLMLLRPA